MAMALVPRLSCMAQLHHIQPRIPYAVRLPRVFHSRFHFFSVSFFTTMSIARRGATKVDSSFYVLYSGQVRPTTCNVHHAISLRPAQSRRTIIMCLHACWYQWSYWRGIANMSPSSVFYFSVSLVEYLDPHIFWTILRCIFELLWCYTALLTDSWSQTCQAKKLSQCCGSCCWWCWW